MTATCCLRPPRAAPARQVVRTHPRSDSGSCATTHGSVCGTHPAMQRLHAPGNPNGRWHGCVCSVSHGYACMQLAVTPPHIRRHGARSRLMCPAGVDTANPPTTQPLPMN